MIFHLDKRRNLEILESSVLEHQGNMLVNYPGNGLNLIATDAGFKKRKPGRKSFCFLKKGSR